MTNNGPLEILAVTLTPTALKPGELLFVTIQVRNNSSETIQTMGPDSGFVYEEGESFRSRGFPEITGAFRAGIDFDGREGIDHPYRWGFSSPVGPGQTATASGAIRLRTSRTANYWAGLVREWIAWEQDLAGMQSIRVSASVAPSIVAVGLAPSALHVGDLLNVSIVVRNDSSDALPTQGPDPGFVYEEGDTFVTRGFPDAGGNFRVGVDFTSRSGIDHPYRWGLGAPLVPGETRTITGSIRMKNAGRRKNIGQDWCRNILLGCKTARGLSESRWHPPRVEAARAFSPLAWLRPRSRSAICSPSVSS